MSSPNLNTWGNASKSSQRIVILLFLGYISIALWGKSDVTQQSSDVETVQTKNSSRNDFVDLQHFDESDSSKASNLQKSSETEQTNKNSRSDFVDLQHFDQTDFIKASNLQQRLRAQRSLYISRLKKDYGDEVYMNIFEPLKSSLDRLTGVPTRSGLPESRVSIGRNHFIKSPSLLPLDQMSIRRAQTHWVNITKKSQKEDWSRFVRKMTLKLMQVQLGIAEERLKCEGDCAPSRNASHVPGLYTQFNWVTGGHSSSAGHGNFYRESYTAVMERAVKPVLESIGIDFYAKSYAMGGFSSGPELSLCSHAVFGDKIDIISWDYGMTDGGGTWKMALYAYQAALLSKYRTNLSQPGNVPHRPAIVGLHQSDQYNFVLSGLQQLGMTALGFDRRVLDLVLRQLPSMLGKSEDEIQAMPPFVKYFRCEGKYENGEPGCSANKWNETICAERPFKTGWHQGWKYHALIGNLVAISLLDAFEDAAKELAMLEPAGKETPTEMFDRLNSQLQNLSSKEEENYKMLLEPPSNDMNASVSTLGKSTSFNYFDLLKDYPTFCHTALLPTEARFTGIMLEDNAIVAESVFDNSKNDIGTNLSWIETHIQDGVFQDPRTEYAGKLLLVKDGRQRSECPEPLHFDYRDFYQISSGEGWKSLILPNDAETKYYSEFSTAKSKGIILACFYRCVWGNCETGDQSGYLFGREPQKKRKKPARSQHEARFGSVEWQINNVTVVNSTYVDGCHMLAHNASESSIWRPNSDGKYDIQLRIIGASELSFLRISSFILL